MINSTLLIFQIVLAVIFMLTGLFKLMFSKEKIVSTGAGWAEDWAPWSIKVIGVLELLAAIGIVLPAILGTMFAFTATAAIGMALTMFVAAAVHIGRKEYGFLIFTIIVMAMSVTVAWYRFI